jgi:hypothetical protein
LQRRPSTQEMHAAFPEEWSAMEKELEAALAERDPARLHRLLQPHAISVKGGARRNINKMEKKEMVRASVRQRMATLAIERYSLAIATGKTSGKVRFNLFNGWLAQQLLFQRGFERKPVSLGWFKLLWPLVWQKSLLMPLVERKGIYCFYSRPFVQQLAALLAGRSCLEIGAGDGTLTRFLRDRGVTITATDDYSWQDRIAYPASVVQMDATAALRHHSPEVVLCSWPPARNSFEREVFRTRSVALYVAIVSVHRFASGNWEEYEAQQDFVMECRPDLSRLLLPPELGCEVLLFRRRLGREEDAR